MIEALRRHIRLLKAYKKRAFDDGDPDYYGEIAAKLRLLLLSNGSNQPLLTLILGRFQTNVKIYVEVLSDRIPLDEFLQSPLTGKASSS
jgi:hypothetical protein